MVNVAGSECVAFTPIGKQGGWLHPSSIPALIWAKKISDVPPHCAIHECHPSLLDSSLRKVLPNLTIDSATFALHDVGLPYGRKRKYSAGDSVAGAGVTTILDFNQESFQRNVYRKVNDTLAGEMMMQASPDAIDQYRADVDIVVAGNPNSNQRFQ